MTTRRVVANPVGGSSSVRHVPWSRGLGARAGEGHARCRAPRLHRLVDENGVIVRVEPEHRQRRHLTQHRQHLGQQLLLAKQERGAFRPPARDVGQHQRLREAAARQRTAVGDEIRLEEPRRRIVPVGISADRHRAADVRRWGPASTATASRLLANLT